MHYEFEYDKIKKFYQHRSKCNNEYASVQVAIDSIFVQLAAHTIGCCNFNFKQIILLRFMYAFFSFIYDYAIAACK